MSEEMYPLETILSVGFLKINEQHYVTIPFADLWLKHLPSHAQLKNECIISGCKRKKTDTVLSTCGLSSHNATVQEIIGKQWNKGFKATRKSKKMQTSTVHIDTQEKELVGDQRFKYSLKQRFLPGIFMAVWSCGMIIGISKMYSFESSTFISCFLCHCFVQMGKVPTFEPAACSNPYAPDT
ncbi:hypothetical protein BDR26DRAFT_941189 [Obelidium mucronatum]|nr:hypothetical protein BDR26DRAFT_941189 [Obelidium mucronatum]